MNAECPRCYYRMDANTALGGGEYNPRPDDFSLCLNCGLLMRFCGDMELRMATEDDESELDLTQRHEVLKAQQIIRARGPFQDLTQ